MSAAEELFPRFTVAEMARRRQAMVGVMADAGVSHLVVYGAERSGSAIPWLTEWPVTREAALVVTPADTDVLFVQHYNHLPNARRLATGVEVVWGGISTLDRVALLLVDRGATGDRVGYVGPLTAGGHARLEEVTGGLVTLGPEYTGLRLVKSAEEIDRLRVAAAMTDRAVEALTAEARVGMTERELAALVESAYVADGGTNHIHYFATTSMGSPDVCVPSQFQSTRRLAAGDALVCEISAAFWGYAGQALRTFTVASEATPLYADLAVTAETAYDAVVAAIHPGAHVAQLVAASAVIEERGYTTYDDLVHGYGGGYLPPVLGSASRSHLPVPDMTLEVGMALVVQPNVITIDERAGVQTGELVVVTPGGCESLHALPRGIARIG